MGGFEKGEREGTKGWNIIITSKKLENMMK